MPGEELVEPRGRVIGDASQHVGEPGLRVDVVELGRGDQGVHRGAALATAVLGGCLLFDSVNCFIDSVKPFI